MHATILAGLIALASLAIGNPVPRPDEEGTVKALSIAQVGIPADARTRTGAFQYAKSLKKYGAQVPPHVFAAAAAAGSAPATPEANDQEYLCPVSVGTPAQQLMMDFDTGSSDFWVFSSELPSRERTGHSIYTSGSSSTSKVESGESWEISYGDGSGAAGNIYSDKVVIGGVTATSQAVEAATSVSSTFVSDTQNDGLVGLGFDNINTATPTKVKTFFQNVQASLPTAVIAAYLKHNAAGAYDLGQIVSSRYSGSIGYAPVSTTNGFWEFNAGTYAVGSSNAGTLGDSIADTGTSIILVPTAVIDAYYSQVKGAQNSEEEGGVIFPCSSTLPTFSVTIGGTKITVPASYIKYATIGSGYCYGGIQDNEGLPFSILGDVFLKSSYAIFDMSVPRFGVAVQK